MSDEPFLSRWSRLKRKEAEVLAPVSVPAPVPAPEPLPAVDDAARPAADPAEPIAQDALEDLPPVESLTADSDFTPFLRAGVPEDLHRQALRKLWASDPVFANDDGLKDYAGDYTGLFSGSGVVKTAYRVGKGFLDALDEQAVPAEDSALPATAMPVDETSNAAAPEANGPDPEGDMINKT